MKKLILLFAFLFTVSSSFISCRDTTEEPVEEGFEEAGEEIDEGVEEIDEEF